MSLFLPTTASNMAEWVRKAAGVVNSLINGKQDTLVSGTNLKTVNGSSLLGSGDLVVGGAVAWGAITGTLSAQTDLASALGGKEPSIAAGTSAQYWRGDKSWQALDKAAVGLANVDNTADASKVVLSATKLATSRSLSMTGDVTWTVSFDGSGNATAAGTLANSGVTAATYGDATHVAQVTVDAKGRVTGASSVPITGGAMPYVGSASVTGSAATTLSLSGLDLNTDQRWFIHGSLHNATTSSPALSLYYNSDTTATNYNRQHVDFSNTTTSPSRGNDALIGNMDSNTASTGAGDAEFWGYIFISQSGFVVADIQLMRTGNSTILIQHFVTQWRTSGTNVTGITISSSVASALAVGSKIELWKLST